MLSMSSVLAQLARRHLVPTNEGSASLQLAQLALGYLKMHLSYRQRTGNL